MKKLNITPAVLKNIENNEYYSIERFINDAKAYIKAIKEGRMIANIENVSKSGMSRDIKYTEFNVKNKQGQLTNFYSFFLALGYKEAKNYRGYFKIQGCGMDMNFNTNYNNINDLCYFGLLSKKDAEILCQKTPILL